LTNKVKISIIFIKNRKKESVMSKLKKFFVFTITFLLATSPVLSAQVVKDDFRINDDTVGGDIYGPDVEILESNEEITVWEDCRNGNSVIYGQAYDNSGTAVDTNFVVSSSLVYGDNPAISAYGDSLLVVWQYGYGQWLLSDGSRQGSVFDLTGGTMNTPDVAVSDSGAFVAWYYSGSGNDIFLTRFDFNGNPIGPEIVVNDDETSENQSNPKIAMDIEGNFIVVWEDYRNNNYDIYGQRFDASGDTTGLGGNFLINDDGGITTQWNPSCAMDSKGNFVVVWRDNRDGDDNIYGQRFDNDGNTIGSNFLLNDDGGTSDQRDPSCAMDSAGNLVVVWRDYRDGNSNIYGQRFDNTGSPVGTNFLIHPNTGSEFEYDPCISINDSLFAVTWRNDVGSIYKRRFLNDGTPVGDKVKVNEIDGTANQHYPAIDMNNGGSAVTTWFDYRAPPGVYFQRLNADGDTLGSNIYIDIGYYPDVSVSENSSFIITYYGNSDIYYQQFMPSGNSMGSPAVISDTTYNGRYYPVIDADSNNNAVVAWQDQRTGNRDIYAQIVDSTGDTVGSNFKVNDDIGTSSQYEPAIAVAPSGKFLITWHDRRNGDYDIYGQVYDNEKNPIGSNFRIDSGGGNPQRYPDAGYLTDGNYIVVWQDNRSPSGIYAQIIDSMGTLIDTNFKVSEVFGYNPSVTVSPSGEFLVTWEDDRDGNYNIYAQKYNSDYTLNNSNYKVNNELEGVNPDQKYPDVATNGNNIIFTWEDAKWQRGWDIAAKVFSWSGAGIEDVKTEGKGLNILGVSSPILIGKEWLTLSISAPSEVDFKIINVAGIVVSSKKLNYRTPGIKKVNFDVSKLPSGPYFLSVRTKGGKAVKKTLVIK
jgi:hypothetical protein